MKRTLLACLILLLAASALLLWRLDDHDLQQRASQPFDFTSGGAHLAGTLWLPTQKPQVAVVLVHGDGAQERTSDGGYTPLINALLDAGVAVASWDKAGVGESRGNWLDQTMADRAEEVRAALRHMSAELPGVRRGALGFSQAGWVLPKLRNPDADFIVLVGPATSWEQQGLYYTRTRLRQEGKSIAEIEREVVAAQHRDDVLFGDSVNVADVASKAGMSEERWGFIRRNQHADASTDLQSLDIPLLAIWGGDDLNVDAHQDSQTYTRLLSGERPRHRLLVIPNASHGLLKRPPYNYQLSEQWPLSTRLRFVLEGRHAYAPGVLERISAWLLDAHTSPARDG